MTFSWIDHLRSELNQPDGWKIAGKVVGGLAAVAAAFAALLTWRQINRTDQTNFVSSRMATIQADLFSENSAARIAGLRSLAALDADAHQGLLGDRAARRRVDKFVEGSLMDSIERLAPPADAPDAKDFGIAADATDIERYQLLLALDRVGHVLFSRGHELSSAKKADFSWLSSAKAADDAVEAIEPVATILDGFRFPRRAMTRFAFSCVSLQKADFSGSHTNGLRFQFADLAGSTFVKGTLDYDSFSGAILRGARFDQSSIEGALFSAPTVLTQGLLDSCYRQAMPVARSTTTLLFGGSFDHASILNTDFVAATASGSTFRSAVLSNDNFNEASLEGARFDSAKLSNVTFDRSRLNGASFDGASVFSGSFDAADLHHAHFVRARFGPAAIESVLRATDLQMADFGGATGISSAQACQLIARGALFVTDEVRWDAAERPSGGLAPFQSPADRAATARCRHV